MKIERSPDRKYVGLVVSNETFLNMVAAFGMSSQGRRDEEISLIFEVKYESKTRNVHRDYAILHYFVRKEKDWFGEDHTR